MSWQLYWRRWHLGTATLHDPEVGVTLRFLFVGPLQMRWFVRKRR